MAQGQPKVGAFTTRASRRVNVLVNEIGISEAHLLTTQVPQPKIQKCRCIWDTGATNTVINKRIIDNLNLKPSGRRQVNTVGPSGAPNTYEVNTYLVNIYLPDNVVITGVSVSEGGLSNTEVLIGMDIIGMGDFGITNYDNKTTWSFRIPSIGEIDFIKGVKDHNWKFGLLSEEEKRRERNRRKREKKGRW